MSDEFKESKFSAEYIQRRIATVPYWWHRIEVAPGVFTPGHDITESKQHWMELPENMEGKKVLDIGAYEGFFSFECERRGADVTALDVIPATTSGFAVAHELLSSKVKHIQRSIYNLDPRELGHFDIVLCLGVLYHLRHPLLGLDRIYSVCKDLLILESQICDRWFVDTEGLPIALDAISSKLKEIPFAQFYPHAELASDPSNWWSPNQIALQKMIETSGFDPHLKFSNGVRAVFHCRKRSDCPPWSNSIEEVRVKLPDVLERTASDVRVDSKA